VSGDKKNPLVPKPKMKRDGVEQPGTRRRGDAEPEEHHIAKTPPSLRAAAPPREGSYTNALVPKLRFPKFRGAEEWEHARLGKLLKKSPEYGVNAAAVPFTEGLPQYLRITDISDDGTYLSDKKVSVDLEPTEQIYLDEGDIVLARTGASVGKSYRYRKEDGRLVFAGFLIRVKPNPELLVSEYLANFLTTEHYWKWVATTSARSGQPGINSVEYGSLAVPLPADFAEQQEIAECLSSVDELIAAQARKVDALKTHKKGLMQQLFPREGETQPRLRFPEFRNAGEWAKMTFGQAATFYNGRAYKQEELLESGKYPVLRVGNFFTNNSWYYSDLELDDTKYCDNGDLLYAWSASFGPRVWRGAKVIYHYHIWKVEEHRGVDRQFLFITLENETERMKSKSANGLGLLHITKGTIEGWETSFPSPAEQRRIASFLSALDTQITAETQKLETLKTHKKGLMQQLFPSPEDLPA
jgi:type I restriction enzyme, S subunit